MGTRSHEVVGGADRAAGVRGGSPAILENGLMQLPSAAGVNGPRRLTRNDHAKKPDFGGMVASNDCRGRRTTTVDRGDSGQRGPRAGIVARPSWWGIHAPKTSLSHPTAAPKFVLYRQHRATPYTSLQPSDLNRRIATHELPAPAHPPPRPDVIAAHPAAATMTRAQQTVSLALLVSSLYFALYLGLIPLPALVQEQVVPLLPFWALVSFGALLLFRLGWGILTFNDVPAAHKELMEEIELAKTELRTLGVSVD
ncbi:Dolichyl-phosphate-mannosyl transferase [Purpureocillium lilacinum]|uniref:Dolichyl-phosphate-mannosyl transferase n=1 Tax=Purpureocillium lilacinum TaxID=33203 RepID=A0A2U3ENU5_PURLI|nr:Dolichyl-phosphate-mannosyl transferase [Purpureocillium lilacinum]